MKKLLHWFLHKTGWCSGKSEAWWDGERLFTGFRCSCGKLLYKDYVGGTDIIYPKWSGNQIKKYGRKK